MTGGLVDQARRLDRAERRWLADARDRLRRTRTIAAVAATTKETDR
ncbi:hypothetical protein [Nocardioides aromaticivorans]|nr:hypothetical protein [Nocardioides aromaticivorans]